MAKFKVGDKVKAIPAIAAVSAPKMKGRVWAVTAVVAGGRRVDLESSGEKLSGIMETALTAANSHTPTVCNANEIPSDLWERLRKTGIAYKVLGDIKSGKGIDVAIKRWSDSSVGSQIPGRSKDAAIAVEVLKEMKRRGINSAANSVLSRNSVVNAALARKQGVAVAANASSADADKSAASTASDVLAALKGANLDRLSNAGDELSSYAAHLDFILPDCTGPYRLKVEKLGREISAFCAKLNDLDRRAKAVAQAASAIR